MFGKNNRKHNTIPLAMNVKKNIVKNFSLLLTLKKPTKNRTNIVKNHKINNDGNAVAL